MTKENPGQPEELYEDGSRKEDTDKKDVVLTATGPVDKDELAALVAAEKAAHAQRVGEVLDAGGAPETVNLEATGHQAEHSNRGTSFVQNEQGQLERRPMPDDAPKQNIPAGGYGSASVSKLEAEMAAGRQALKDHAEREVKFPRPPVERHPNDGTSVEVRRAGHLDDRAKLFHNIPKGGDGQPVADDRTATGFPVPDLSQDGRSVPQDNKVSDNPTTVAAEERHRAIERGEQPDARPQAGTHDPDDARQEQHAQETMRADEIERAKVDQAEYEKQLAEGHPDEPVASVDEMREQLDKQRKVAEQKSEPKPKPKK
jgi:hypothetical protein